MQFSIGVGGTDAHVAVGGHGEFGGVVEPYAQVVRLTVVVVEGPEVALVVQPDDRVLAGPGGLYIKVIPGVALEQETTTNCMKPLQGLGGADAHVAVGGHGELGGVVEPYAQVVRLAVVVVEGPEVALVVQPDDRVLAGPGGLYIKVVPGVALEQETTTNGMEPLCGVGGADAHIAISKHGQSI